MSQIGSRPSSKPHINTGLTSLLGQIWSQFSIFLVLGAGLIYLGELWRLSWTTPANPNEHHSNPFVHALPLLVGHIGVAVVVATLIGILFHFREFSELFLTLAKSTLIEDGYLEKLKPESLLALRASAGRVIIGSAVDNEKYDRKHLESLIDDVLFKKLLPTKSGTGGVYRQNLVEMIILRIMTLKDALEDVGAPTEGIDESDLTAPVIKSIETTEYELVAPRKDTSLLDPFNVPLEGNSATLKGFPKEKRVKYQVGTCREDAKDVEVMCDTKNGGFHFIASGSVSFGEGKTTVWCRRVEYKSPIDEPFMLKLMNRLTRNMDVRVNVSGGSPFNFSGGVFGLGDSPNPEPIEDGIRLKYNGWMLEDHGYYVWWWKE